MGSRDSSTTSLNSYSAILINLFCNPSSVYPVLCSSSRANLQSSSTLNLYTSPKHDVSPKNKASKQKDSRLLGKQRAVNEQEMLTHGKGRNTRGSQVTCAAWPLLPGMVLLGLGHRHSLACCPSLQDLVERGAKARLCTNRWKAAIFQSRFCWLTFLLRTSPTEKTSRLTSRMGKNHLPGPEGLSPARPREGAVHLSSVNGSVSSHPSQCITSTAPSRGFSIGNSSPNKLPLQPQEVDVSQQRCSHMPPALCFALLTER